MKIYIIRLLLVLTAFTICEVLFAQPTNNKPPSSSPFSKEAEGPIVKGGFMFAIEPTLLPRGLFGVNYHKRLGASGVLIKLGFARSFAEDKILMKSDVITDGYLGMDYMADLIDKGEIHTNMLIVGTGFQFNPKKKFKGFSLNYEARIGKAQIPSYDINVSFILGEDYYSQKTLQHIITLNYIAGFGKRRAIRYVNIGAGIGQMNYSVNKIYWKQTEYDDTYLEISSRREKMENISAVFSLSFGLGGK